MLFPSAICLVHLRDNPLEIPPQIKKKPEEQSIVWVLSVFCFFVVVLGLLLLFLLLNGENKQKN